MTAQTMTHMATTSMTDWPIALCTLHEYITMLCTPACFVPQCLIIRRVLSTHDNRQPSTCPYVPLCAHQCHDTNQQPTTTQHLEPSCISAVTDVPQPSLNKVTLAQLDHPLDDYQVSEVPNMALRYWQKWPPSVNFVASQTYLGCYTQHYSPCQPTRATITQPITHQMSLLVTTSNPSSPYCQSSALIDHHSPKSQPQ